MKTEKNLEDINKLFKNSHRKETCFILGNGPSLTLDIIKKIAQKDIFTFTVNGFALVLNRMKIDIHAVCMSNQQAIDRYIHLYPDNTLKFIRKTKVKFPAVSSNIYELPFVCEHEKGLHREKFIKDGFFSLNPFIENYCGDTVILDFCFPLAFFMGFTTIYLGGVDCDYIKRYFIQDYELSNVPQLKGMLNNDFSIAIPSYRYAYTFLRERAITIRRFTESEKLNFIPFINLDEI